MKDHNKIINSKLISGDVKHALISFYGHDSLPDSYYVEYNDGLYEFEIINYERIFITYHYGDTLEITYGHNDEYLYHYDQLPLCEMLGYDSYEDFFEHIYSIIKDSSFELSGYVLTLKK